MPAFSTAARIETVASRRLGASTVIVNLQTNDILELNETGSRIWELLPESGAVPHLASTLTAEFDIEQVEAEREVTRLLEQLASQGVVRLEP